MSSEISETISSGSRIRQFGLYRTIDARTEEFLRLSRKRQIKQGCACAAVSTAITVIVVISVLLVYEYSINTESNSSKILTIKSNWYRLLNETDGTGLNKKFAQKNIKFDSTTLKLLPVLLKALSQNRYLEKIIDDYASSSPAYDKKRESTEFRFKKNIFVNERWAKMPTSRLFALEYKTSPLVYYKSPTITSEYFTKVRKIRDYQRMLNYFDKMINEKVKSGLTLPIVEIKDMSSQKPYIKTVTKPMRKHVRKTAICKTHISEKVKTKPIKDKTHCKCSRDRGELLQKLISNVKLMMLDIENNKSSCEKSNKKESLHFHPLVKSVQDVFSKNTFDKLTLTSEKPEMASKTESHSDHKINKSKLMNKNNPIYRIPYRPKSFETNMIDYPLKNKNNINEQFYKGYILNRLDWTGLDETTSTKINTISSTTTDNDLIEINDTKISDDSEEERKVTVYNFIDNWLQNNEKDVPDPKYRIHEPLPVFSDIEYDDYFSTTPKINNDTDIDFENLDFHSVELLKLKNNFVRKNNTYQSRVEIKPTKPTVDFDSQSKNSSLFFIDKMVTVFFPTIPNKVLNNTYIDPWKLEIPHFKNIANTKAKTNNIHNKHETTILQEEIDQKVPHENILLKGESLNSWKIKINQNKTKIKTKTNNNTHYQYDTTKAEEGIDIEIPDRTTTLKVDIFNTWNNKTNFQDIINMKTNIHHYKTTVPDEQINKKVPNKELQETISTSGIKKPNTHHYQYTTIPEEEIDKEVPDEDLQEAEITNQRIISNNTTGGIDKFKNLHDILKITGESKKYRSMLPMNRPVYLEINRNDWRRDDHLDFDTNLYNNNFDFSHLFK